VNYRCEESGTTALHQAAGNAHKDVVDALLEADASVDDEDLNGSTALHFAISADIVEALIMSGSDVDHENGEGKTPGRLALDRQDIAVVRALISGRADLSKIYEPRKDTYSSKRVTSSNISEVDTGLPQAFITEVPSLPEEREQDGDGQMSAMAIDFADLDMHLSNRDRDNISSSSTPDDQSTEKTTSQPHAIHHADEEVREPGLSDYVSTTMTPEVCSPPPAVDKLLTSTIDQSSRPRRLVIGIVSVIRKLTIAPWHRSLMMCTRNFTPTNFILGMP
jgi:hypothetical protein